MEIILNQLDFLAGLEDFEDFEERCEEVWEEIDKENDLVDDKGEEGDGFFSRFDK